MNHEPPIDYQAMIHAAFARHKYRCGTGHCIAFKHGALWRAEVAAEHQAGPIDMVLHCPSCFVQHIDAPDTNYDPHYEGHMIWENPPHRSHLCHNCGHIWRPADVPTNGVQSVKTVGKSDSNRAAPANGPAPASQHEVTAALISVGRDMVNITTTVRGIEEWPAIATLWLRCMEERDALRGAQLRPAAEPPAWPEFERIRDLPAVDEAISALLADNTGDNATCVVRAVLEAVGKAE